MQQEVEIKLPDYQEQYAVECYLNPGFPYQLFLSKTQAFSDTVPFAMVSGAFVVIKSNNTEIILFETTPGVYESADTVPMDYDNMYFLEIETATGERISSSTSIIPPAVVDSVQTFYGQTDEAAIVIFFTDTSHYSEYFLLNIFSDQSHIDYFSKGEYNGSSTPYVSPFRYEKGDELGVEVSSISKEYYEFIRSYKMAQESNNRPITEPPFLQSNIVGGTGIFTGYSLSLRIIVVE
ncbi:MAG: DUF4249 family protein [Bacteroidia bacterium]